MQVIQVGLPAMLSERDSVTSCEATDTVVPPSDVTDDTCDVVAPSLVTADNVWNALKDVVLLSVFTTGDTVVMRAAVEDRWFCAMVACLVEAVACPLPVRDVCVCFVDMTSVVVTLLCGLLLQVLSVSTANARLYAPPGHGA